MYEYPFEKLEAWKESKNLSIRVYKLTKRFPHEERYGLVDQMRRANVPGIKLLSYKSTIF